MHAPIYTDGSKSSECVGCATVFPDFDMFKSLPVVASIFIAELYAISSPFLVFHSTTVIISIFILTRNGLQVLGSLYTRNPFVLKINFLCDLHIHRKFVSFWWIPSDVSLSGN